MFRPPRCPNRDCVQHHSPSADFYIRKGYYRALCRAHPVPRFQCRSCGRGFSRQTFRADYRDHRPALNARLFLSLASGIGLRRSARKLGLSLGATESKARKIGRHLESLNLNLRGPLPETSGFVFEEVQGFGDRRNARPFSFPMWVERESRFVLWARAETSRSPARGEPREKTALEGERRIGPRVSLPDSTLADVRERTGPRSGEPSPKSQLWRFPNVALQMWLAYHNYVVPRFPRDDSSSAQRLGLVRRRMKPGELLSWRQDWGGESIHPLQRNLATIASQRGVGAGESRRSKRADSFETADGSAHGGGRRALFAGPIRPLGAARTRPPGPP